MWARQHIWICAFLIFIYPATEKSWSDATDCTQCERIHSIVREASSAEKQAKELLQEKQRERESFAPSEVSKKMKLTASILVLVSHIETFQNRQKSGEIDLKKLKCSACLRKHQNQ